MRSAAPLLLLALGCSTETAQSPPVPSSRHTPQTAVEPARTSPAGSPDSEARPGPEASAEPEPAQTPDPAPPLPSADTTEPAEGDTPRPQLPGADADEWRRFFVDGCWRSLAETRTGALDTCARIKVQGSEYERELCRCEESLIIEVRSDDPVFGWNSRRCWNAFFARTQAAALRRCERESSDYTREHCPCEPDELAAVRGPYARSSEVMRPDSPFVYLGTNGEWLDETGDWPCFAAGTPIETPEGVRPIEAIAIGERVRAYDVDTGEFSWSRVRRVKERLSPTLTVLTMKDESVLTTTPNHPFYLPREQVWRAAQHLRANDTLLATDGAPQELLRVDTRGRETPVFNLSTEAPNTYFAGGVLVHNY